MKKYNFFVLGILLAVILQGCGAAQNATVKETVKLKVQLVPYFSYAPLYIAKEEGYFAEQGIDVEFQKLQGGTAFVSLVKGDIDVAASFLSSTTLSAINRGEKVKVVADKGYVAPTGCVVNGLLARKVLVESGELIDVKDLAGKKLKFDQTSVQAYYMDSLLKSAGLTIADVTSTGTLAPRIPRRALPAIRSRSAPAGISSTGIRIPTATT